MNSRSQFNPLRWSVLCLFSNLGHADVDLRLVINVEDAESKGFTLQEVIRVVCRAVGEARLHQ